MKKLLSKLNHFWNEDRSLTVSLILLLSFIFILVPTVTAGRSGGIIIKIVYSLMLLTGILSVAKYNKYVAWISIITIIGLVINWVSDIEPTTTVLIAHDIGTILFNFFFAVAILIKTFRKGEITFQRIEGSVVVYLLVGLIFAFAFRAIYLYSGPSSFHNISGRQLRDFIYFSFTTLTTTGYGDITAIHPLARSLANFEALIGQLYPAILIGRLVSMEFESSARRKEKM